MTLVVDASTVVAALVDAGPEGEWSQSTMRTDHLVAPHILSVEVTNALRRATLAGVVAQAEAEAALGDLADLPIEYVAFGGVARRVWELRASVTSYDAWYVAVAEGAGSPLATLDRRLARASGPTCQMLTP